MSRIDKAEELVRKGAHSRNLTAKTNVLLDRLHFANTSSVVSCSTSSPLGSKRWSV